MAGLYLKFLRQTLFYAQWAGKAQNFAGNGERIDTHPVWGQARRFRYRDEMLFSPEGMHSMLGILCSQNRKNRMARDYLFSYLLLARDLESFVAAFDNFSDSLSGPIPVLYQQALALYWVQHNENSGRFRGIYRKKYKRRLVNSPHPMHRMRRPIRLSSSEKNTVIRIGIMSFLQKVPGHEKMFYSFVVLFLAFPANPPRRTTRFPAGIPLFSPIILE